MDVPGIFLSFQMYFLDFKQQSMAVSELHKLWLSQTLHPNLLLSSLTANSWTLIPAFRPPLLLMCSFMVLVLLRG